MAEPGAPAPSGAENVIVTSIIVIFLIQSLSSHKTVFNFANWNETLLLIFVKVWMIFVIQLHKMANLFWMKFFTEVDRVWKITRMSFYPRKVYGYR